MKKQNNPTQKNHTKKNKYQLILFVSVGNEAAQHMFWSCNIIIQHMNNNLENEIKSYK